MPIVKSKRKSTHKRAAAPSAAADSSQTAAAERFKRDLLVRGEAAYPDDKGKLPSDATHEIIEETKESDGLPRVKRRLFKLF